jgi:hypothetical protein
LVRSGKANCGALADTVPIKLRHISTSGFDDAAHFRPGRRISLDERLPSVNLDAG